MSESGAVFLLYELRQCFIDLHNSNNAFTAINTIINQRFDLS